MKHIHPLLRRERRQGLSDDSNYAVLNALDNVLNEAEKDTIKSKIQSSLETATGEYLDHWGDWFGIYRAEGEDDEHYREHIIRHTLLPRGTIQSIIDAIKWFLDDNDANIEIYEPWKNIFYTNKSLLNGEDHLMGYYYRFAIIDITIDRPFPPEIRDIIWAFKPAGVLFYVGYDSGLDITAEWVESPYENMTVHNTQELDRLTGVGVNIKGNMKANDINEEKEVKNIFHTNRSNLNGTDVLAGAFDHNRDYIHLYGTALKPIALTDTSSLATIKTLIDERNNVSYNAISNKDSLTDRVDVSSGNIYMVYNVRGFIVAKYKKEYEALKGENPDVVNKKDYADFLKEPTLSISLSSLATTAKPTTAKVNLVDFTTGKRHTIRTYKLTQTQVSENIDLSSLVDYINSEGLVVVEISMSNTESTVVDIDYVNLTFKNVIASGYGMAMNLSASNKTEVEVPKFKAWSWSADGTDRFTTKYPNENLIVGGFELGGLIWDSGIDYEASNRIKTGFLKVNPNTEYTIGLKGQRSVAHVFQYDKHENVVTDTMYHATKRNLFTTEENTKFVRILQTDFTDLNAEYKLELGDKNTPYTPSPKDDPINAVPQYVGFSDKDSSDPKDYIWRPV